MKQLIIAILALTTLTVGSVRAEVYGVGADGTLQDITNAEWRPVPAAPVDSGAPIVGADPSPVAPTADLRPHFAAAAQRYGLSETLVTAVAWTESRFRQRAVSPSGAQGVMQLMPATARDMGVADPLDPIQNIHGGTRYLRMMLDRFDNNLELALAAYNAGPGAVQRHRGVPPYRETRDYVRKIIARLAAEASATKTF